MCNGEGPDVDTKMLFGPGANGNPAPLRTTSGIEAYWVAVCTPCALANLDDGTKAIKGEIIAQCNWEDAAGDDTNKMVVIFKP
jgi:hypothetical protein